jgi:putative ABC transport system permease protein
MKPSLDELLRGSLRAIWRNKSRTILTSLGIIIGVTSVILLTSIGNGLKRYINRTFESLGSNLIYVTPGKVFKDGGGFNNQNDQVITLTFTQKDVNKLAREIDNAIVFPASQTQVEIKYKNKSKTSIAMVGMSYEGGEYRNLIPESHQGRWFTPEEDDKRSQVIIIGPTLASDLFGTQNPLSKQVIISGKNFKVIGISPKKGNSMGGPDLDSYIYTPIKTVFALVGNQNIQAIQIKAQNQSDISSIKKKAEKLLLQEYEKDTFSVFDQSQLLSSINGIIGTLTVALTGIAAISLIVGGIGIMNIMLVTVTERTREIGLRKAIGAYPRAILLQFLFEAIILSGLGGTIGIILGSLGTLAISRFFPAQVTLNSVLIAFGVSSLVGIIFGVAPARKASKLSPIEALRYE